MGCTKVRNLLLATVAFDNIQTFFQKIISNYSCQFCFQLSFGAFFLYKVFKYKKTSISRIIYL